MTTQAIRHEADRIEQMIFDLTTERRLQDEAAIAARQELAEAACLVRQAAVLWAKETEAS